jgi:exosortase A
MGMTNRITNPGWRLALLVLLLVWAGLLAMHRGTVLAMVAVWDSSETFAHAWVVPPISAWLAWRLRGQVMAIQPRPAFAPLLLVVMASFLWLMGELVSVNPATQYALVSLLVLAVPAVLGWQVARALIFPLGFLYFAVPAGEFLTPYLMTWTADITVAALRFTGIPVFREGLLFVIPTGTWSVVEACSGIRYLLASVMVGTLYAYLNYRSMRRRLLFVLISIAVPLLANWLRAYMIVMLGHLSNNEIATGADHLVYGWALFGVIIMLLYWIGARWADSLPLPAAPPVATGPWPVGPGVLSAVLLLALALAPLQLVAHFEQAATTQPVRLDAAGLPGGLWRPAEDPLPGWSPAFPEPNAAMRFAVTGADNDGAVGVYVAYYRNQSAKRKLVSTSNRLLVADGPGSNAVTASALKVPVSASQAITVRAAHMDVDGPLGKRKTLVWQTYWIDGQWTSSDVKGKLVGAFSRLMGRGDDAALVLLYADEADPKRAEASLTRFAATGLPEVRKRLEAARAAAVP